jgi:hypothetical protein
MGSILRKREVANEYARKTRWITEKNTHRQEEEVIRNRKSNWKKGQLHGETKMTREGRLIKRKELVKILGHPARITMNSEFSP